MKTIVSAVIVLLVMMVASACFATPTLTTPSTTNLGANMATLVLKSSENGTGYFTLLYGSNASCGTGTQVKAGETGSGAAAPYFGSQLLTADTDGYYTVRNLTQSTAYTICFSADSPSGSNLNPIPVAADLTTNAAPALTNLDWSGVGNVGFSAGTAYSTSLAFAPDGIPYVAYGDGNYSVKATVMKFSGGAWSSVGSTGFTAGAASSTSLAFSPDGTPYVAYADYGNSGRATVMKYSGGAWSVVGNAGFSSGLASNTSLAFSPDGTPYVAYGGDDNNSTKATVLKFSEGVWSVLGSAGISTGTANFTSLAIAPDGSPYVAYSDYGNNGKVTVKKYNSVNGWVDVGSAGAYAAFTSLAIAPDGTPHVAYSDYGNSAKSTVMKYNGVSWSAVGSAGFSAGPANSTSLALAPDGTPCVAYYDAGIGKATVMNYNGSVWNVAGSAEFSAGTVNSTTLAFAPDGIPFVAYGDDFNGSRATVMKLKNPLALSGTPAATATLGTAYSFTPTVEPPGTHIDSFSVTGTLPPGLNLNSTGVLSGTPTTLGTYSNIVITATNATGSASLQAFSITVIDTPDTNFTSSLPANPDSSASFSFSFSSTAPGSTFECSLNGGSYATCPSTYTGSIFPCTTCRIDTAMTFAVRAKSLAGNIDPTPASYAWTINNLTQTLFDNVLEGGVVQLKVADLTGDLNFSRSVAFTLRGGYDSGYSTNNGVTNIHGTVTVSAGTVTVENIVIM